MGSLLIDARFLRQDQGTGVHRYTTGMLQGMAELTNGPEITLFGHRHSRFKTYDVPSNRVQNIRWLLPGSRTIDRLFTADHLWLPNTAIVRTGSIPYTLTVHDVAFYKKPSLYSARLRVWHYLANFRKLLLGAHKIVTVSESTRNDVLDLFDQINPNEVRAIYPSIKSIQRSARAVSQPEKYILFVGTVEPRKNVAAILSAFERIQDLYPELYLVIAGKYGWLSKAIKKQVGQNPRVIHKTYVSDEELDALYRGAQVFVWPSFYEGFGFPPLEAALRGVPVITSFRTSLPEVLENNAQYINPYIPDELARAIQSALTENKRNSYASTRAWKDAAKELIEFIYEDRY